MSASQPVRLNEDGKPFPSREDAVAAIKAKELDPKVNIPRKYQGGWCILDLEAAAAQVTSQMESGNEGGQPEKFFLVEFSMAGSVNDMPYVPLVHNLMDLRVQRGREVVIPEKHLKIAQAATMKKFEQGEHGAPLKETGVIARYPVRIIREATREEFEKGLAAGNEIQNKFLQQLRKSAP